MGHAVHSSVMYETQLSRGSAPTCAPACAVEALQAFAEGEVIPIEHLDALVEFGMVELPPGETYHRLTDDGDTWMEDATNASS